MKTTTYNPSPLEVEFAKCLKDNKNEINEKLNGYSVTDIEQKIDADNPLLKIKVKDDDGDEHVLMVKLIQKPDSDL